MRVGLSRSEAVFRGLLVLVHAVLMDLELIHVVLIAAVMLTDGKVVAEEAMAVLCADSWLNWVLNMAGT